MPKRIQLTAISGGVPEGTVDLRPPSLFANPWSIEMLRASHIFKPECIWDVAADNYRDWLTRPNADETSEFPIYRELAPLRRAILERLPELRGKDLCNCDPLDKPSHIDVLLELANGKAD